MPPALHGDSGGAEKTTKPKGTSMIKRLIAASIAAVFCCALATATVGAQTLDKIKQRGTLIVGTKPDYKPFGFRDPTGAIVGFEPDLAKDVADKLGVKLELEPVVS